MKVYAWLTALLFATCQPGLAQNVCDSASSDGSAKINEIKTRYDKIIGAQREKIQSDAQKIKDSGPETTGPDAKLNMDFEVRDNLREIKLDVPEVTMKRQNMSMDLPQVAMKRQTWSWDVPELVMELECRAGPDEWVMENKTCTNDFPRFDYPCPELRPRPGPPICLHVPKNRPRREEVVLDVPEVTVARSEWSMDVPEIKMATQTMKINIPELVLKSISAEAGKQKRAADELSAEANKANAGIAAAMNREISAANKTMVVQGFSCQRQQLTAHMREAFDKLNANEKTLAASYNTAREVKANDLIPTYEKALVSIKASKEKMLKDYMQVRRDLRQKEKQTLDSIKMPQF